MITDKRIVDDINIAIDRLNAIKICFERDGFVAETYVEEKAKCARHCVDFVLALTEGDD